MKHTIEGIVEIALSDSDVWVKLIANIVKTYPMEFNLNLDLRSSHIAQNVIQQLTEKGESLVTFALEFSWNYTLAHYHYIGLCIYSVFAIVVKEADTFASLPLECQLVNKTSLQSLVGSLPPLNRHFAPVDEAISYMRKLLWRKCKYQ